MLVTLLAGCAFNGIESVFGLWTQARFNWGPQQVGSAFAVTGVVAAICQIAIAGPASKRFGEPEDIGEMVCWLLSDRARYAVGGAFIVDGGQMAS